MLTQATDGKMLVNISAGYVRLGKMAMVVAPPSPTPPAKLDLTPRDVGMVIVDVALAMETKDMLIKQGGHTRRYHEVMASTAMLVSGALVNALAFSGSNYLFSMLRSSGADEEKKRHDKAIEQLQAAHEA